MKVFTFLFGTFPDDHDILGVFSSREDAEGAAAREHIRPCNFRVEEWDVETPGEMRGEIALIDPYSLMTGLHVLVKLDIDENSPLQGMTRDVALQYEGRPITLTLDPAG